MQSRAAEADHEQPGSIGNSDNVLPMEHDGRVGLDCDALHPGFHRELDGAEPDRRLIGAAFLTGFLDLDEYTARAFAPYCTAPQEELVGALDRFDAEHEALLNDHGLADVESPQYPSDAQPMLDIGLRLPVRQDGAKRPLACNLAVEQLIRSDDPKALPLEFGDHSGQQTVIAQRTITDAGKKLGCAPVRTEREQRRTPDAAGESEFGDIVFAQQSKARTSGAEAAPGVRYAAHHLRFGRSHDGEHEDISSGRPTALDKTQRQAAAPGHDAEPTCHSPLSAGRSRGSNPHG